MKIYILIEISSGEVPSELDSTEIFTTLKEAQEAMKKNYEEDKQSLLVSKCEIEVDEINENDFWVSGEDYDSPYGLTTFRGYIITKDV